MPGTGAGSHELRFEAGIDTASFDLVKRNLTEIKNLANEVATAFARMSGGAMGGTMGPTGTGGTGPRPGVPTAVGPTGRGPLGGLLTDLAAGRRELEEMRRVGGGSILTGSRSASGTTGGVAPSSPLDRPLSVGGGTGGPARFDAIEAHTVNIQAHEVKITATTATLTGAAADPRSTAGTGVATPESAGGGRGGDGGEPPEEAAPAGASPEEREAARAKRNKMYLARAGVAVHAIKTGFDIYDFSQRSSYQDAELDIYRRFSDLNQEAKRSGLKNQLYAEAARGSMASVYAASQLGGTIGNVQTRYGMEAAERAKLEAKENMAAGKMLSSPVGALGAGIAGTLTAYAGLAALGIGTGGLGIPLAIGGMAAIGAFTGGSYLSAKGQKAMAEADLSSGAPAAMAVENTLRALRLEEEKHKPLIGAIESYGANAQGTLNTERALARLGYRNPISQITNQGLGFGISRSTALSMAGDIASNRIVSAKESEILLDNMFALTRAGYSQQSVGAAESLSRYTGYSQGSMQTAQTIMDAAAQATSNQLMQEKIVEATANFGPINRTGVVTYEGTHNVMGMLGAAGPTPVDLQVGQMGMQGFAQSGQGDFQRMAKIEKLKSRFGSLSGEQLMYLSTLSPVELADYGNLASVLGIDKGTAWDISKYDKGLDADTSIRLALGPKSEALKAMRGKTVAEAYPMLKPEQQLEVQRAATYYGIVSGGMESADSALKMLGTQTAGYSAVGGKAKTAEAGTATAEAVAKKAIAAEVFGFSAAQQALTNLGATLTTTVNSIQAISNQLAWSGKMATEGELESIAR
jgi:hypothetical protein